MTAARTVSARADLERLDGLTWATPVRDDLSDLVGFLGHVDAVDQNPERTSLDDLREYWDSPLSYPEEDLLLARDQRGRVAALARAWCSRSITERRRVLLMGAVRPDLRGRGIGRRIMAWQLAHARDWDAATRESAFGPLVVHLTAPEHQQDVRHLAERFGLHVVRHFLEMQRPLAGSGEELPAADLPDGVRIVGWDARHSRAALDVLNRSFRDHWNHADITEHMWHQQLTSHTFRPLWTLLALDRSAGATTGGMASHGTGDVVGVALNVAWEQDWIDGHREGYTERLGVLRSHRGCGIARALLVESMRRFAADGMDAAVLGVDVQNPSGALGLYESLGYHRRHATCVHELVDEVASAARGEHDDAHAQQAQQRARGVPAGGAEAVEHHAPDQ